MAKAVFVNVMSPASSNGNIDITFTQNNVQTPITFTITTAVLAGDNEKTISRKIWAALDAGLILNNAKYSGTPSFLSDPALPFTFDVIRTDHILSVWSQSSFDLDIVSTAGCAQVHPSNTPIFPTLQMLQDFAQLTGVKLLSASGLPMSVPLLVMAARASSAKLVSMMGGFNVIPSTYAQSESGEWQRGVTCRYAPVKKISPIVAYSPYYLDSLRYGPVLRAEFDEFSGAIWFADWSNSVGISEVADFGNSIIWSYVAGHEYVSDALAQISVQVVGMSRAPVEVSGFKAASFSMEFRDPDKAIPIINAQLSQFAV